MLRIRSRIVKKRFGSPVAVLISGTVLSQIVIFASTLVIGHLYLPSQFGFYAYVATIAGILALILSRSFETFVVPAKNKEEADKVFVAAVRLIITNWVYLAVLSSLGFCLLSAVDVSSKIDFIAIGLSLILAPLLAFYALSYQLILRNLQFKVLATRGPIQNFAIGISQWIFSYSNIQSLGLVFGEILGRILSLVFLVSNLGNLSKIKTIRNWRGRVLDKINQPTRINFFSILCDMSAAAALLIFVNLIFGDWAAGQIAMAQRIIVLPIVILGVNLAQYYLSSGSDNRRKGINLTREVFDATVIKLFLTALSVSIILFLSANWIIDVFLGVEWTTSGKLIRFLLPYMIISFVWNPISSFYYINGLWVEFLKISTLRLLLICVGGLVAKSFRLNLYEATIFITVAGGLVQIFGIYILRKSFNPANYHL